ncbi:MAG TPA: hypothetical protein VGC16_11880 [Rhizomicrobium sp.]
MALVHHDVHTPSSGEEKRCALMFCATWVGFFVLIALFSLLISAL